MKTAARFKVRCARPGAGAPTQISVGGQRVLLTVLIDYIFEETSRRCDTLLMMPMVECILPVAHMRSTQST
jgi:hypothetical protein